MNNEEMKDIRRDPFEGKVIDAEDVIARDAAGLPQEISIESEIIEREEMAMRRYKKLGVVLGEGAFKKVYKAIDQEEGKEVAWNEVRISENEYYNREKTTFSKEISLLKSISHPNILKIFDYWFTKENFIFITELMTGGTLREYIASIGDLNIKLIKKWAKQVLEGLDYLHSQNPPIIHRDIKCENIFVNASLGEVKIGDLGIAKERRLKRYTVVGTPQFMAREMFEGDGYNEKVDIYAFGMCLIEMATGMYPYKECIAASDIYKAILQGVPPVALYSIIDPCLKNLILSCLVLEKDRIDSKAALRHHFFNAENECPGNCVPLESILVQPLTTPANDMEISLVSFEDNLITFQLFFMCEAKFIKFGFDINEDSVEAVAEEMLEEEVVDTKQRENLIRMLRRGIERALERKKTEEKNRELEKLDEPIKPSEDDTSNREKSFEENSIVNTKENTTINLEKELSNFKLDSRKLEFPISSDSTLFENSILIQSVQKVSEQNELHDISSIKKENESVVNKDLTPDNQKNNNEDKKNIEAIEYPVKKYEENVSIEEFSYDTATITNRPQEAAVSWIKIFKANDIFSVTDLKLLVDEDWDKLGLSVFISRSMKNMLFGIDKHPLKEKQLLENSSLKNYDNSTDIVEFLDEITKVVNKKECKNVWEGKLLAQDIRTVGELKSLHQEDWERLGLTVFAYRAIKNMIFRKGKII